MLTLVVSLLLVQRLWCRYSLTIELWLIGPFAVSPPRRFAPWLVRPWLIRPRTVVDSPPGFFAPVRGIIAIRRQKLYAYNLLFIIFQGFLFRLRKFTFIQRKTTVQQHYKSKSFPTNPKAKVNILLSTFDVQSQIYFSTEIEPFLNFEKIIISVVNSSKCVWTFSVIMFINILPYAFISTFSPVNQRMKQWIKITNIGPHFQCPIRLV